MAAQEAEVSVEGPNVGDEAESVQVGEEVLDEGEVVGGGAEGGDEAGVGEREEGEAARDDVAAVVVVGKVEAGVTKEDADEAVVVDAEDAAIGLGHLVEQVDGVVDETGFYQLGYVRAVGEAVCANAALIHIRFRGFQRHSSSSNAQTKPRFIHLLSLYLSH